MAGDGLQARSGGPGALVGSARSTRPIGTAATQATCTWDPRTGRGYGPLCTHLLSSLRSAFGSEPCWVMLTTGLCFLILAGSPWGHPIPPQLCPGRALPPGQEAYGEASGIWEGMTLGAIQARNGH